MSELPIFRDLWDFQDLEEYERRFRALLRFGHTLPPRLSCSARSNGQKPSDCRSWSGSQVLRSLPDPGRVEPDGRGRPQEFTISGNQHKILVGYEFRRCQVDRVVAPK